MFISFEGIDNCGKTTQIKLLAKELEKSGQDFIICREPGGTIVSEKIREIILDKENTLLSSKCELMLYLAARAQVVNEIIEPALKSSKIVICDRFYDSTFAYQGGGRELDKSDIELLNNYAIGEIKPNITFLIDISVEESNKRLINSGQEADRMENSGNIFMKKVRKEFLNRAKLEPNRIKIIDALQSIEEIQNEIKEILK